VNNAGGAATVPVGVLTKGLVLTGTPRVGVGPPWVGVGVGPPTATGGTMKVTGGGEPGLAPG